MSVNIQNPFVICPPADLHNIDELQRISQILALKYAYGEETVTDDDLKEVGNALYNSLDVTDELEQALEKSTSNILHIIIESDSGEIQALPWESLYHPKYGFLGKNSQFTLSRRLKAIPPTFPPLEKGPLRVLLFTSLPDDLNESGRLNVEEEQIRVQEALLPAIAKGKIQLEMPDDGRFSTFEKLLCDFSPHLLFLTGHGEFHHQPHTGAPPYGTFVFEDQQGNSDAIHDDVIAKALANTSVQAVVLASCESGKAVSNALNDGLIQKISQSGIPHVIGMREALMDQAGNQFAYAICSQFAGAVRVDVSLQAARRAIQHPLAGDSNMTDYAENSLGQWVLPTLYSSVPERPLIDWDFSPLAKEKLVSKTLSGITFPARFIGRRAELREYKSRIFDGELKNLLITGAGGYGKTALAGKLVLDLQEDGYKVFAWSGRKENPWQVFENDILLSLNPAHVKYYKQKTLEIENEQDRISVFLKLLSKEFQGKLIIFFDGLGSIQDEKTLALKDATLNNWLEAASKEEGLILLATSRWKLKNWDEEHLALPHTNYGDFLQMAERFFLQGKLPERFLDSGKIRHVYEVLGGNSCGLEFFASALISIDNDGEDVDFSAVLKDSQAKTHEYMAIEKTYNHLSQDAKTLLHRLPAFQVAVPLEGILQLGVGLETKKNLTDLMNVSLVEVQEEKEWDVWQYQLSPLVREWLHQEMLADDSLTWRDVAANYQLYLFEKERETLKQCTIVHSALQYAERKTEADRLALKWIVEPLNRQGSYQKILDNWLLSIAESNDKNIKGEALAQIGKQYYRLGNFKKALPYLEESLTLARELGELRGETLVLNNLSLIYKAFGDYQKALEYSQRDLAISQMIGDKTGKGATLGSIGSIYYAQGEYEKALSYFEKSLEFVDGKSETLGNMSNIYLAQGDYEKAIFYLQIALEHVEDKATEASITNNIGVIYRERGDYGTALSYFQNSLALSQKIGDKKGEGSNLGNIGIVYFELRNYKEALNNFNKALSIQEEINDKAGECKTLGNISNVCFVEGNYEEARANTQKSLALAQEIGDQATEGGAFNSLGEFYRDQGDYEKALDYLKKSLDIRQEIGEKTGEATVFNNIGLVHNMQGDFEDALTNMEKSLFRWQEIGNKAKEATVLHNISLVYNAQEDYGTALLYLQKALSIEKGIGDKMGEGRILSAMGGIYSAQGDFENTFPSLQNALLIQQEIGDKGGLCQTHLRIGWFYLRNNKHQEATKAWVTSYQIAKEINSVQVLFRLK